MSVSRAVQIPAALATLAAAACIAIAVPTMGTSVADGGGTSQNPPPSPDTHPWEG